jgi:16S rRNA (guanine966-N2)-methyltransferase
MNRSVRIIAGRWKGRRLEVPEGTRPTLGRAREALFSIVQKRVPGAAVLDLYAGSGAIGLEAVSRGAARAVLVEKDAVVLRRNLERLPPPRDQVEILAEDAEAASQALARTGHRFDLIFADPPYGLSSPAFHARAGMLASPGGLVILQSESPDDASPQLPSMSLVERRAYGRNVFLFFSRDPSARAARLATL